MGPGVPQVNEGSTPKPESRSRVLREPTGRSDQRAVTQVLRALSKLTSRRSQPGGSGQ
jgi:hypothetical protein